MIRAARSRARLGDETVDELDSGRTGVGSFRLDRDEDLEFRGGDSSTPGGVIVEYSTSRR